MSTDDPIHQPRQASTGAAPPFAPKPASAAPAAAAPSAAAIGSQIAEYLRGPAGRAERRPTPRFSVLAAVAAAVMMVVGTFLAAASGDVPRALFTIIMLVLVLGGYALVWLFRDGPLASAGATASTLGFPLLLVVALTGDEAPSLLTIGFLSLIAWLAAFFVGPGRGHVAYAGFSVFTLAMIILGQTVGDGGAENPAVSVIWVALLLGVAYLGIGYLLDRADLSGVATAFAGSANVVFVLAILAVFEIGGVADYGDVFGSGESNFSSIGNGVSGSLSQLILPAVLLIAAGVVGLRYGVAALRRATAWTGAALVGTGVFALLMGLFGENGLLLTFSVLILGGGLVYGAWFLSTRIGEADELAEAPSFTEVGLIQAVRDAMPVKTTDPEVWRSFGGAAWYGSPEAAAGSPGPGWWIASDGRWYPPQAATPAAPDPRPAPPAAPVSEVVDPRPAPPAPPAPPAAPAPEVADPRPAPPAPEVADPRSGSSGSSGS